MSFEQFLLSQKIISEKDLHRAQQQKKANEDSIEACLRLGILEEEDLIPRQAEYYKVPYINLKDIQIDSKVAKKIPAKFAHHYSFVPISIANGKIKIATNTPLDIQHLDDIKLVLKSDVEAVLSGKKDIQDALKKYYGVGAETVERMIQDTAETTSSLKSLETKAEKIDDITDDASMIKFVNQIMLEAYQDRATDIHIEPFENELIVRYRIDGILYDTSLPPSIRHFYSGIVSRIKIMANLNIAEKRAPQDGRIKIKVEGNDLDLRVSILPTPYGESVNIRLLNSVNMLLDIKQLGMSGENIAALEETITRPYGMILLTGPTGSGKTTTLYSCLSKLNKREKKIITIEDPIEYLLKGITQIQVLPKIGLTFANGLRSMLRHDPDSMMVGEIRDKETAEISIRIALTGHLLFSTLHTNDAAGAITRLVDMGIEPFLVSSSLECIIAQRLVRVICPDCKEEVKYEPLTLKQLSIPDEGEHTLYTGKGCAKCKFTGYVGRTAIHEMLVVDNEIRELIVKRVHSTVIKEKAIAKGMSSLRMSGFEKVKQGLTTLEEISRVTEK